MAKTTGRLESPVDNETYNLMSTLTSKLEALEVYERYLQDVAGESRAVFEEIAADDRRHAEMLMEAVRQALTAGSRQRGERSATRAGQREESGRSRSGRGDEPGRRQEDVREPAGREGRVNPIQVQKYLKGVDYPVRKSELVDTARREGADQRIVSTLERLPERDYEGPSGVTREIGNLD